MIIDGRAIEEKNRLTYKIVKVELRKRKVRMIRYQGLVDNSETEEKRMDKIKDTDNSRVRAEDFGQEHIYIECICPSFASKTQADRRHRRYSIWHQVLNEFNANLATIDKLFIRKNMLKLLKKSNQFIKT